MFVLRILELKMGVLGRGRGFRWKELILLFCRSVFDYRRFFISSSVGSWGLCFRRVG